MLPNPFHGSDHFMQHFGSKHSEVYWEYTRTKQGAWASGALFSCVGVFRDRGGPDEERRSCARGLIRTACLNLTAGMCYVSQVMSHSILGCFLEREHYLQMCTDRSVIFSVHVLLNMYWCNWTFWEKIKKKNVLFKDALNVLALTFEM